VAADAALTIDPTRVEEIAEGLGRLLEDEGLRQTLIERGTARAREFTWTAAAAQLRAVYAALV
jgi:alpha-1,3-rhamnosyl/mannosyltransferase